MFSPNQNKLIFSNQTKYRIRRHLLYWGVWYCYMALTHGAAPFGSPEISYFKNPLYTCSEAFFLLLSQVPMTYILMYIVLPNFIFKKKYVLAAFFIAVLWIACGVLNIFVTGTLMPKILSVLLPPQYLPLTPRSASVSFFMAITITNKGAFTIASMALLLKVMKDWYLKEQRNIQLQKEKAEAQFQLLTAQVHPHFLFNTLNNIYSQVQVESPKGSKMIMGLSNLLRYILYEGQKSLVPLQQELQMITEYVALEKMRYGNKLDIHVVIPSDTKDIYIAPLMLLPFVENCFKHGTSNILQNPWINLAITLKDNTLVMKLMNGKLSSPGSTGPPRGIGITNVSQRLNMIYSNNHQLQITEEEEVFVVDLKIELMRIVSEQQDEDQQEHFSTIEYA